MAIVIGYVCVHTYICLQTYVQFSNLQSILNYAYREEKKTWNILIHNLLLNFTSKIYFILTMECDLCHLLLIPYNLQSQMLFLILR